MRELRRLAFDLLNKMPAVDGGRNEWLCGLRDYGGNVLTSHAEDALDEALNGIIQDWMKMQDAPGCPGVRNFHSVMVSTGKNDRNGQPVFSQKWLELAAIKKDEALSMQVVNDAIAAGYAYHRKANALVRYLNEGNRKFQLEIPFEDLGEDEEVG